MGKKSFALVKEILKKQYGRYPTRAELFEECYYRDDGLPTSKTLKEAIVQMKELDAHDSQNLNGNQDIYNPNDSFAKIMGKDKDGQLRMCGLGVTIGDVYGAKSSRAVLFRQAMEYKAKFMEVTEKYDTLNAKLENLSAYVHKTQSIDQSEDLPRAPSGQAGSAYIPIVSSHGQVDAQSPPLSSHDHSFGSNSIATRIKVGSYVVLQSLSNINEIVATGIVDKMNNVKVNGMDLGSDFCQVVIQYAVKKDARLVFPFNHVQTIGSSIGVPIAWPLSLVALDDEFHC